MTYLVFKWLLFILSVTLCVGLYEDQIGKFEWRKQYIGKLKFAQLDVVSPTKKIVVATEQNVIATLSMKTGDIIWRQILESDENGTIKLLSVDNEILTVSGTNTPLVRGWELDHGYLLWEWPVTPVNEFTNWMVVGQKLVQIDYHPSSHFVVTGYQIPLGKKLQSQNVPSPWLKPENCVVKNNVIACVNEDKTFYSIKISEKDFEFDIKIHHRSVLDLFKDDVTGVLKSTAGKLPLISLNVGNVEKAILLQPEITVVDNGIKDKQIFASTIVEQQDVVVSMVLENQTLIVTTKNLEGEILPELGNQISYPESQGTPEFGLVFCQPRRDRGVACRILISTSHNVISFYQHPGKMMWSREESLASIITVEMINLPVSDTDAAIEKEFNNKNCGFIEMFFRRIISQSLQLQNLILTVLGLKRWPASSDSGAMIHDEFGLHKIIVAVTKPGKIYGIDNLSGKIVWQLKIDDVEPFSTGTSVPAMPLFLLRNARHHPLPAECAVLMKDKTSGETLIIPFNPITGVIVGSGVVHLGFKVKQSFLLHLADEYFTKGIIFLDEDTNVHVYPESAKAVALSNPSSIYIFTADAETGIMKGFTLSFSTKEKLISTKTWQICLGSKIISVVGKNRNERVHSQGRVLGDRSVLYKYVNPNLVTVITRAYHPSYKTLINLFLIDVVSGNIIYSSSHRRAKEPVHVVHSENWVVYTYFNEKYRRTELASLEMYEGKTQSNATVFSSIDSTNLLPIVEKQAYILPANVLFLKDTVTEKGITSKHILVALSTGGILELPWMYTDPRRPMTVTPEMREEGVIPYMPELPTSLEAIINHNQTINNIRGIHTSSSGLESTCLVFAYGLDIFYTRVAPSKTFDLLKDDFDYYLITLVLLGLTMISYVTKKLASRKALKQAWK